MQFYKIIQDDEELKKFIDFLPDLQDSEQFYVALFARSKYDTTGIIKSDKAQLGRFTSTKDRLIGKLRKWEVKLGSYDIGGREVPQESLAVYITPNPRCMRKASIKTAKMILDNIEKDRYQNPKTVALNAVQITKSRTVYVDFDFDIKNEYYDRHLKDIVYEATGNLDSFDIIKTRGGFHVLVKPELTTNKMWHPNLSHNQNVDQMGDLLLPLPGCSQGGFSPKFI